MQAAPSPGSSDSERDLYGSAMPAVLSPVQAWNNSPFNVMIAGRKSLNGSEFTEVHEMSAEISDDNIGFQEIITHAISAAIERSSIPADLIEGVSLVFTAPSPALQPPTP